MTLNGSKCKMMVILRRHQQFLPEQGLFLQNEPLELVEEYRYLGIILNSTLNWSAHIESICRKTRRIVGMLYRTFYVHANSSSLIQLYLSLVHPHLEYGCAVWDPYTKNDINQLEGVQKFVLRVCCKQWSTSYEDLLSLTNIPELKTRRTFLKLCIYFFISMGHFIFSHSLIHKPSFNLRSHHNVMFAPVHAHTNVYKYAFFPHCITLLSPVIVNTSSVKSFRTLLSHSLLDPPLY